MKRTIVSLAALLGSVACGCDGRGPGDGVKGSGAAKSEARQVAEFDQIEFVGAGSIQIAIGERRPLDITADDNLLPLLKTETIERRLIVRPVESISPKTPIVIKATAPNIEKVSCDGAGKITVVGVKNESLRVEINGAGYVFVDGETEALDASIAGAGIVSASGLRAGKVAVTVEGAGSADVHAIERLDVTLAGMGAVRYSGDPEITKQISGLGSLTKKNEPRP